MYKVLLSILISMMFLVSCESDEGDEGFDGKWTLVTMSGASVEGTPTSGTLTIEGSKYEMYMHFNTVNIQEFKGTFVVTSDSVLTLTQDDGYVYEFELSSDKKTMTCDDEFWGVFSYQKD